MKQLSLGNRDLTGFILVLLLLFLNHLDSFGQVAVVQGYVLDQKNVPLANVNIGTGESGTISDENGHYSMTIPATRQITLRFSHLGHKDVILKNVVLNPNETLDFNPIMKERSIQIAEVVVRPTGERAIKGVTVVPPELALRIPGANPGVENTLKLLPGVSFNSEFSSQYNVRGGNFDENLVYVNGIEVYRPFLIRSAQQEGFSFINSSMVAHIDFSAGGFQAKYGDKLSSVLDITYKTPHSFSLAVDGSLLGASTTLETISQNEKFTSLTGVRYRNNALLINSQQTQTNVNPIFFDAQTYLAHRFSDAFSLSFLGHLSINDYTNEPSTRQTNFGTLSEPRTLFVSYEGRETNTYENQLGALKAEFSPNRKTVLSLTSSLYHAVEEEFTDLIASYGLGVNENDLVGNDPAQTGQTSGVGSQLNRARNQLDALFFNISHKGKTNVRNGSIEWGFGYSHEDVRDRLNETEFLDATGFLLRPPSPELGNNEPEEPFEADIVPFESARATNAVKTDRFSAFLQWNRQTKWKSHDIYYNLGLRAQHWSLYGTDIQPTGQTLISPRGQFSIAPNWNREVLFRLAAGSYQQPPLYRELRNANGEVNPNVEAQTSFHLVAGNEYRFSLFKRPFTLISEAYYKILDNVNAYTIEDVRIRYRADNGAEAYALGMDLRLSGAFIPGTTSWISVGYLETKERMDGRDYISRPTDQRLKVAALFQDYMPSIPNLKLYANLVYNTGVPGGSPSNADPYRFQNRLRDYRRADLGISYIFADRSTSFEKGHWLSAFRELDIGFEIFNLFNHQNSITNTWVRDVDTQQQFAVPNYLTSRLLNLRLHMKF